MPSWRVSPFVTPYRDPCWPEKPLRPRLRRYTPVRVVPAQCSLLLTLTVYLLVVAVYIEHPLVLAVRLGLRMPSGCGRLLHDGP